MSMGRPKLFMERLWKRLPSEILESKILPCLPIPSLCRFKTVCKKWNNLISDPNFALTHSGAAPSPEEHVIITVRAELPFDTIGGWDVLDVANNTVYTISDDFLTKFVKEETGGDHEDWMQRKILAADGGLFFLMYDKDVDNPNSIGRVLVVCNPVLRTAKILPPFREWPEQCYECVAMSTDRLSMEYEIFVFLLDEDHFQTDARNIYESKTGRWRMEENSIYSLPSSPDDDSREPWYSGSEFVKTKNGFFRLFTLDSQMEPKLVSYDEVTGVATDLGFDLQVIGDDVMVVSITLVVSEERLFCVVRREYIRLSYKIFEVMVASKECIECTEIPPKLLKWLLGDDLLDDVKYDIKEMKDHFEEPVVAIGCASSLLFCSYVGRSVAYNLEDKSWHWYSDNNLLQAHKHFSWYYQKLYCNNHCLSLCAP